MSEFEQAVILIGVVGIIILAVGAIFTTWLAIRSSDKEYLDAYQGFLEQKNRVEKRLNNRRRRHD